MAIYEYFCPNCRCEFELVRSMKEADTPVKCPKCHGKTQKLPSVFGSTAGYGIKIPGKEAFRGDKQ